MIIVLSLGTRLRVHMRTTFENGVLHNRQQPGSAVNSSIDQGEFRAMKTLSGRIAPCCDKHQFCDKMTVSTWTIFEILLLNIVVWRKKEERRMRKMAVLLPHTFAFSCLPRGFWALVWVLLIIKALNDEDQVLKWAFSISVARRRHPYIESLPTLWRLSDTCTSRNVKRIVDGNFAAILSGKNDSSQWSVSTGEQSVSSFLTSARNNFTFLPRMHKVSTGTNAHSSE